MKNLSEDFTSKQIEYLNLDVPALAMSVLEDVANHAKTSNLCIGGGFARGLYMQQVLGLNPEMNDIDIFTDLQKEDFLPFKRRLVREYGKPVRFHNGEFDESGQPRGLLEFVLPSDFQAICAGVKSIQINSGDGLQWAKAEDYVQNANVGINQVAITLGGFVIATPLFISDMTNKKMTMNKNRDWELGDWKKTIKKIKRLQSERPEFFDWTIERTPEPESIAQGRFWDKQRAQLKEELSFRK